MSNNENNENDKFGVPVRLTREQLEHWKDRFSKYQEKYKEMDTNDLFTLDVMNKMQEEALEMPEEVFRRSTLSSTAVVNLAVLKLEENCIRAISVIKDDQSRMVADIEAVVTVIKTILDNVDIDLPGEVAPRPVGFDFGGGGNKGGGFLN